MRADAYTIEQIVLVSILFLTSTCLLILSVVFKSTMLSLFGFWLLAQLFVFYLPFLSFLSKMILSAASSFSVAVFFLVFVVLDVKLVRKVRFVDPQQL